MQVTAESKFIGLGVAGNFAGHLEQAGEASDFVREYTLASGGPYCDCGYKKKGFVKAGTEAGR